MEPEFLWESASSYGVFRRPDNDKWFGIIMTVDRSKVELAGHGNMEIINLKAASWMRRCMRLLLQAMPLPGNGKE